MSHPIKHHYIPQSILSRFCDANNQLHSFNKCFWHINRKKFSPADQAAIKRAAIDAAKSSRTDVRANEERLLAEMLEKGAKIARPDIAPFRKAVESVYEKVRAVYGKDVDAILADAELVRQQK